MCDLELLTLSWHSFPEWCRESLSPLFDYEGGHYIQKEHRGTIDIIVRWIVGYLNATINRTTRNAEPDLGPDECSHTRRYMRVARYGAVSRPPTCCGLSFWTVQEPNRTLFPVQTQTAGRSPRPIANTTHTRKHFGHRELAKLEWWPGQSKRQQRQLRRRRCIWYRAKELHWACTMPERQDMSDAASVPGLVRPTQKSNRQAEMELLTVNPIETRRKKGLKTKLDRMRERFIRFFMQLDREFQLEIYYWRMVSSCLWISVDKQMYSRRNESFGKAYSFSVVGEWTV